jgi:hypothetical protein
MVPYGPFYRFPAQATSARKRRGSHHYRGDCRSACRRVDLRRVGGSPAVGCLCHKMVRINFGGVPSWRNKYARYIQKNQLANAASVGLRSTESRGDEQHGRSRSMSIRVRDALKFVVLLVLGGICTVSSVACLPAIGLGTALLSVQTASWVRSAQWHPVPLSALLENLSHSSQADWSLIQPGIEHLLSMESGPILIAAAGLAWALALILFDRALKKWRPTGSIF